ncbi:MAG TPA: tetratricopeptide repeat protein [Vicinamibacterales bacterium]|jgi:tetratricopeptide (TPR) repeat protein|nr:tetratricopeptide repeat protein [Vicinamibacterales bacterium]
MMRATVPFLASLCVVLAGAGVARAQERAGTDRYLVIPFDNPGHETRIYWLAEASAMLLADNLNAAGRHAYTREERFEAFEQLQIPSGGPLSHATAIRLGQLVGATHVVIGSIALRGAEMTVRAQNIRLDTGRLESEVVETGSLDDLFGIFDRVTRRLASLPAGRGTPGGPAGGVTGRRTSLQVFENYVKGLIAASTPTRVGYLQSALKLDPSFDLARLAIWSVNEDGGNAQAALLAAAAVPETSALYARARFDVALSLIQLKRLDDASATLRTLADRVPSAAVMNNLGVVQIRRPVSPQTGKSTYYFDQAVRLDPDDPDYYFNLGYAYWTEHDAQGSIYWLREAVRRRPADGEAHAVLGAALQAVGSNTEAARERELATQLSSTYAEWARRPAAGEPIPRGLERLKPALEVSTLRRVDTMIAESGERDQRELAAFHLDRGRRLLEQGSDEEAIGELRRALYLSPYQAEAHLLLGRIYLQTGQTQAAIDAFKIALWSSESAEGHLALARAYAAAKKDAAARTEAQRALTLAPGSAEAKALVEKLKP